MSISSIDIERNCITFISNICEKNKHLVIGYIRIHALEDHNLNVPPSIINYCILYLFLIIEKWDKKTNYQNLRIENEQIVYGDSKKNGWQNVFGTINVLPNTSIHEWNIKFIADTSDSYTKCVLIGLAPKDVIDELHNLNSFGWFINNSFGGHGLHLEDGEFYDQWNFHEGIPYIEEQYTTGNNVILKMIFDTDKGTLSYTINNHKCGIAMQNIPKQTYKLAVSTLRNCAFKILSYKQQF
eukprot:156149_1